jgi:hypothetical protein
MVEKDKILHQEGYKQKTKASLLKTHSHMPVGTLQKKIQEGALHTAQHTDMREGAQALFYKTKNVLPIPKGIPPRPPLPN